MKVYRVMTGDPVTVQRSTPVRTAMRLLSAHAITTLPVVDEHGRIVGVVGEFDLLDAKRHHEVVEHVMHRNTVLVHPETELIEVSRILRATRLKSMPVVDAADQVVGMVSRSDIIKMLARDDGLLRQDIADALCAAGLHGWQVDVHNGVADLVGPPGDEHNEALARRTAEETLGVDAVRTR